MGQGGSGWKLEQSVVKTVALGTGSVLWGSVLAVTTALPATGKGEACTVWQGADLSPVYFYPKHLPI